LRGDSTGYVGQSLFLSLLLRFFLVLGPSKSELISKSIKMARAQIYALLMLLFSCSNIHVLAANNQGPLSAHVQPGDVRCWASKSLIELMKALTQDCRVALQQIPSGRITFEGGDPRTWSIESSAQRRKFLPAEFKYRTCHIRVRGHPFIRTSLPRSLDSLARTMYYHVWPVAREGVERVLQNCTEADGRVTGIVTQYLTFDGHGPYALAVTVSGLESEFGTYHVYDAAVGDAEPVVHTEKTTTLSSKHEA
jgi:hypothetical protein